MLKVFISQSFVNKTKDKIFEERDLIIKKILKLKFCEGEEVLVFDQYAIDPIVSANRFYYLSKDLLYMGEADLIVFAPDWEKSKACRIEHAAAYIYGLPIYEVEL